MVIISNLLFTYWSNLARFFYLFRQDYLVDCRFCDHLNSDCEEFEYSYQELPFRNYKFFISSVQIYCWMKLNEVRSKISFEILSQWFRLSYIFDRFIIFEIFDNFGDNVFLDFETILKIQICWKDQICEQGTGRKSSSLEIGSD